MSDNSNLSERLVVMQELLLWSRENRFLISELAVDGLQVAVQDLDPQIEEEGQDKLQNAADEADEFGPGEVPSRSAATQYYADKFGIENEGAPKGGHPRTRR